MFYAQRLSKNHNETMAMVVLLKCYAESYSSSNQIRYSFLFTTVVAIWLAQ